MIDRRLFFVGISVPAYVNRPPARWVGTAVSNLRKIFRVLTDNFRHTRRYLNRHKAF